MCPEHGRGRRAQQNGRTGSHTGLLATASSACWQRHARSPPPRPRACCGPDSAGSRYKDPDGGERKGGDRETGRSIAWKALRAHWSEEEVGGEDKMEVGNKEKGRATEIKRAVRDEEDEERLQTRERVGGRARKSGRVRFAASGSGGTDTPRDVQ